MAIHSSVLAWRIPGTGEPAVYGVTQSRTQLKRLSSSSSSRNIYHKALLLFIYVAFPIDSELLEGRYHISALCILYN